MDLIEIMSLHYGLSIQSIALMSTGRVNRTYKIVAGDGESYCLKVYSDSVSSERLHAGLDVTTYLAPLGFPVPRVAPTITGEKVLVTTRFRVLLLHFIPGRNLQITEVGAHEARNMGALLGKMHHSLRFFPDADRLHDSLWRGSEESLPRLYDLLRIVQSKPQHDDFDRFVISTLIYRIQVMQGLDVGTEQFSHLPRQPIHGDYQIGNVLFDDTGHIAGLLDFDQVSYSFPAWELMRALGLTCMRGEKFDYTLASSMLSGYRQAGGHLSPAEYLEMPRLWYYQLLRGLFGLSDHYSGTPDPRQDEAAYGLHNAMVYLGSNMKEMRNFLWESAK